MCFVLQKSWLINMLCATWRRQLLHLYAQETHLCFVLTSYILFFVCFAQWRSPGCMGAALWLDGCRIAWSHWKCLCHFKSLPCLSGWHHCLRTHYITPSQALSLKDSTTLCLLSHKHIHAHTETCLSVYKCDININTHINNNLCEIAFYACAGEWL